MPARALDRASHRIRPAAVEGDQELVDRTVVEVGLQLEPPPDEGFHGRQIGQEVRIVFLHGNRRSPGGRRPVEERHIVLGGLAQRDGPARAQRRREPRVPGLEPAQAVVARPQVELARPLPQRRGRLQVPVLGLVGLLLHEGVGVLREAARGRQQQSPVLGGLIQKTLDQLQRERQGVAHERGVVVRGVGRAALRQGVTQPADGELPDGAAGVGELQRPRRRQRDGGGAQVACLEQGPVCRCDHGAPRSV